MGEWKPAGRERIAGLDGLRAIAILAVVVAHSVEAPVMADPRGARWSTLLYKLGPFGVRLFFAISGYLITSLFVQELQDHGPRRALGMFYIRRVYRIVPPLIPYLAAIAVAGGLSLLPANMPVRGADLAAAGLFAENYFRGGWLVQHFWSLAVEEHFYLLWPPLMALAGERASRWWCVAIVGAVAIVRPLTLAHHPAGDAAGLLMETHLIVDFLVYAALLALLVRNPSVRRWLQVKARPVVLAGLFALLMLTDIFAPKVRVGDPRSLEAALFALIVVLPTLRQDMWLVRWLEHPALVWIGRRSYSIYIWQQLFLLPLAVALPRRVELFFPRVVPLLVVAALSYRYLEEPMIRKGRRLANKVMVPRVMAAGGAAV
jgi:peptidoglycan/LPS O-acetylase OafA/YrhL